MTALSSSTSKSPVTEPPLYFSASDIMWEDKHCILLTLQDITSVKLNEEKQLIEKIKQTIFNTFTHELLTPLNGMICSLSVMRKNLFENENVVNLSKTRELFLGINSCAVSLKYVVNDYIDYHLMQSNSLELNLAIFSLRDLLNDIALMFQNIIRKN